MALESTQPLIEIRNKGITWVVKATDAGSWQLYLLHVLIVYKFWEPKTPTAISACSGLYKNSFTFYTRHPILLLLLILKLHQDVKNGKGN